MRDSANPRGHKSPQKTRNEQAVLAAAARSGASHQSGRAALSVPMYMLDEHELQKLVFGLNMTRRRKPIGMSQQALADILKVDRREVNRWERGHREPRPPMRKRIAEALGVPLDHLYDERVLDDSDFEQ